MTGAATAALSEMVQASASRQASVATTNTPPEPEHGDFQYSRRRLVSVFSSPLLS